MIYIKQTFADEGVVIIQVDGVLDRESLPAFKTTFYRYFGKCAKIVLSLEGLAHIDQEGKAFLRGFQDKVNITGLSEFLKMELGRK
jgi:hypothetical protein